METSLPSVSLHEEIHYLFTTSKYIVCVLITRTSISPSGVAFQTAVGEIITSDLIGRPLGVKDSERSQQLDGNRDTPRLRETWPEL